MPDSAAPATGRLKRELRLVQAIALSVGILAPTGALALDGSLPASLVGTSVPLVMLLGSAIVVLVAYGFIRMAREFAHPGSAYAFSGLTLGPRAGFFAGWAILLSYVLFASAIAPQAALFGTAFLEQVGIGHVDWLWISLGALALVGAIALAEIKFVTTGLLTLEFLSVVLVLVLFAVILINVIGGSAPDNQSFSLSPFGLPEVPSGVGWSAIFAASVGGFIAYAGFEGSATLGGESKDPRRRIPRALMITVAAVIIIFTGGFFVQTLGFGLNEAGVEAFAGSSNSLADLGQMYIGKSMADLLALGATFSAFGSCLGCTIAASRVLYAMSRDLVPRSRLSNTSSVGAPAPAILLVLGIGVVVSVGQRLNGTNAANAFFYPVTMGVLTILVAYICVTLGTLKYFFLERRIRVVEGVIPVAALGLLGYVLYKQIYPVPEAPYNHFPYYVGALLLVGLLTTFLVPGLAQKVGSRLAAEVSHAGDGADELPEDGRPTRAVT